MQTPDEWNVLAASRPWFLPEVRQPGSDWRVARLCLCAPIDSRRPGGSWLSLQASLWMRATNSENSIWPLPCVSTLTKASSSTYVKMPHGTSVAALWTCLPHYVHFRGVTIVARSETDGADAWLADLQPTARQTWSAVAVAAVALVALAAVAPFSARPLAQLNAFFPSLDAIVFVTDLVTAVLLYAQFSISRSRSLKPHRAVRRSIRSSRWNW